MIHAQAETELRSPEKLGGHTFGDFPSKDVSHAQLQIYNVIELGISHPGVCTSNGQSIL